MTHFSTSDHLAEVLEAYSHPADERTGEITRAAIERYTRSPRRSG